MYSIFCGWNFLKNSSNSIPLIISLHLTLSDIKKSLREEKSLFGSVAIYLKTFLVHWNKIYVQVHSAE